MFTLVQSHKLYHMSSINCHVHLRVSESKLKSRGDKVCFSRKCQVVTMETKVKIIERMEQGKKMADTTCSFNIIQPSFNCEKHGIDDGTC